MALETLGRWQRMVTPTADKLGLPGKMGVELRLPPNDSIAAADLIRSMALLLDAQEARYAAVVKMLWTAIAVATLIAIIIL